MKNTVENGGQGNERKERIWKKKKKKKGTQLFYLKILKGGREDKINDNQNFFSLKNERKRQMANFKRVNIRY